MNITILTIQQTLLIWILKFLKPYSMMILNGSMLYKSMDQQKQNTQTIELMSLMIMAERLFIVEHVTNLH